ncbi:hypothetical protein DVH05_010797 [Phytophthora capsici]|nr:hypothetical protein DVH05_010797 [Phytophthora capsici]
MATEAGNVKHVEVNANANETMTVNTGSNDHHIEDWNMEVHHQETIAQEMTVLAMAGEGDGTAMMRARTTAQQVNLAMKAIAIQANDLVMTRDNEDVDNEMISVEVQNHVTNADAMDHEDGTIGENAVTVESDANGDDRRNEVSDEDGVHGTLKIWNCQALPRHRELRYPLGLTVSIWP